MTIKICAIAAMSENRVIGRDNGLPWHIPEDLKFFKAQTLGKPVIMGRRTFDSIGGKPLPGRENIIISREQAYLSNVAVVRDVPSAIEMGRHSAVNLGKDEVMIIGGGQIYTQALPLTDRVYLTVVHKTVDGDTFFPELDEKDWHEVARDDRDGFSFLTLERRP